MTGRISLLVSQDLRVLVEAARTLDSEVRKRIRMHTKAEAAPIWRSETAQRTGTRLQNKVLVSTSRVSVTDSNVMLKSAQVGKLSSGTPVSVLAGGAEFGGNPNRLIQSRSRRGTPYKRRMGNVFGPKARKGHVFHPAAHGAIPRVASLWLQTAIRTVAETFEKAGA